MLKHLALLLVFSTGTFATTFTGTLPSPLGGNANGTLSLAVTYPATVSPTCQGSLPGLPYTATVTDGAVNLVAVVGNDCLLPSGTSYIATFTDISGNVFYGTWRINGATFNLSAQVFGMLGLLNVTRNGNEFVQLPPGTSLYLNNITVGNCTGCGSGGGGDPCTSAISSVPSGLHCLTVTLSQADILALGAPNYTPFVVVPTPGAGNVIFPFGQRWKMAFASQPYFEPNDGGVGTFWDNISNPYSSIRWGGSYIAVNGFTQTVANFGSGMVPTVNTMTGVPPSNYTNVPLVVSAFEMGDSFNCGPAASIAVNAAGAGYHVGDQYTAPNTDGADDALYTVASIGGGGSVATISITNPGTAVMAGTALAAVNVGNITSSAKNTGGSGYAIGDTGTVDGGTNGAVYVVDTTTDGAVATYHLTNTGTAYTTATGATTTATTGGGNDFTLDIVAGEGSGLTVDLAVTTGDGTLTVTTWYVVAPE